MANGRILNPIRCPMGRLFCHRLFLFLSDPELKQKNKIRRTRENQDRTDENQKEIKTLWMTILQPTSTFKIDNKD